jgi:ABC-type multidrug transport system ATPase subunit
MDNDKIIEVHGLTKKFGKLTAVSNLELNVLRGDVFGFLGPNGAGKSTTIRMLLTLIFPTSGHINIFGKPLSKNRKEILSRIGAIVEKPDFYPYLSAYKNLEIFGRISGCDTSKSRIMSMLDLVGLSARAGSKVKTYSHGMKQRLGIAQALMHDPELIILDEPTTGLDPQGMKDIRDLIISLSREQNKTVLLSSHLLNEVEYVANRMIIINKGTTVVEGSVTDLLDQSGLKVDIEVDDIEKARQILSLNEFQKKLSGIEANVMTFEMPKSEIAELNRHLVGGGVSVSSIVPRRSLEEYFLNLTEGQ